VPRLDYENIAKIFSILIKTLILYYFTKLKKKPLIHVFHEIYKE
jgi:hypothetical protein